MFSRRELIRGLGTAGIASLAGCLQTAPERTSAPRIGTTTPERRAMLAALDSYADAHDVPTFLATVNPPDGARFSVGRGFLDRSGDRPIEPDALFRIASLSKPITAAATRHLVAETEHTLADPFLPLVDVEAPAGEVRDSRLADATIRDLLTHQAGWDRIETFDPIFAPWRVVRELGIAPPPTARDYARFVLDRPLQFAPGTRRQYANVGYLFLGLLIEAISGKSYQSFVAETVFDRAGIDPSDFQPGRTRPAWRPERETWYAAAFVCPDITSPEYLRLVRCPNGGFPEEAMTALGGHVATPAAYDRFMAVYDRHGRPHTGRPTPEIAHGSKRGTRAIAYRPRPELSVVVFLNRRTADRELLRAAIDAGLTAAGL